MSVNIAVGFAMIAMIPKEYLRSKMFETSSDGAGDLPKSSTASSMDGGGLSKTKTWQLVGERQGGAVRYLSCFAAHYAGYEYILPGFISQKRTATRSALSILVTTCCSQSDRGGKRLFPSDTNPTEASGSHLEDSYALRLVGQIR